MSRKELEGRLSNALDKFRRDTGYEIFLAGEGAACYIFIHEGEENAELSPKMSIEKLAAWFKGFGAGFTFTMGR